MISLSRCCQLTWISCIACSQLLQWHPIIRGTLQQLRDPDGLDCDDAVFVSVEFSKRGLSLKLLSFVPKLKRICCVVFVKVSSKLVLEDLDRYFLVYVNISRPYHRAIDLRHDI